MGTCGIRAENPSLNVRYWKRRRKEAGVPLCVVAQSRGLRPRSLLDLRQLVARHREVRLASIEDEVVEEGRCDTVKTKLGRNLLMFQRLELMLKFLLSRSRISGSLSELPAKQAQAGAKVQKQTLGNLVTSYVGEIHANNDDSPTEPEDLQEAWATLSFRVELDPVALNAKQQQLASALVTATECFDLYEVPMEKGGTRLFYKSKQASVQQLSFGVRWETSR
jgi:hypothetical protein